MSTTVTSVPSTACKWGLRYLGDGDLNQYVFPDLEDIVERLQAYAGELNRKPPRPPNAVGVAGPWPAVAPLKLKLGRSVTQPGIVLVLGNPRDGADGSVICDILNGKLPVVSYKITHWEWKRSASYSNTFTFTNKVSAEAFFRATGAIAIMRGDTAWAGPKPATQLEDGGVMVNAHSNCSTGLMVHEIVHCYGGPAGFVGEGLTDWFAIDLMKGWKELYGGNPAYAYQVSLVDRLVRVAGKERVARLAFADKSAMDSLRGTITGGRFPVSVSGAGLGNTLTTLSDRAFEARQATMQGLGLGEDVVPVPASGADETARGVPGLIDQLGRQLVALLPL